MVIWVLSLVLLLGTAISIGVRYRTRADTSLFDSQRAEAAAESAINLAILLQLSKNGREKTPFPLTCRMPGGEQVTISVTEEAGKVDLNTSSAQTLVKLFVGLTQDRKLGEQIAAAILSNRPAAAAAGQPPRPQSKVRAFQSVLELEAVAGITPELFRRALPLVTVRSGKPEPDPAAASETLRETLGFAKNANGNATTAARAQPNEDVTIRADVAASKTARFIREALVSLRQEHGGSFSIREWRHGEAGEPFVASKDLQPCFSMAQGA